MVVVVVAAVVVVVVVVVDESQRLPAETTAPAPMMPRIDRRTCRLVRAGTQRYLEVVAAQRLGDAGGFGLPLYLDCHEVFHLHATAPGVCDLQYLPVYTHPRTD